MSNALLQPPKDSLIFQDKVLYACLASFPMTKGHTIVAWKKPVSDLHLLSKKDYEHLMNAVDAIRNALIKTLGVEKVYLVYMDEIKHVHWHLIPRYNKKGFNLLEHDPKETKDFRLAEQIRKHLD